MTVYKACPNQYLQEKILEGQQVPRKNQEDDNDNKNESNGEDNDDKEDEVNNNNKDNNTNGSNNININNMPPIYPLPPHPNFLISQGQQLTNNLLYHPHPNFHPA